MGKWERSARERKRTEGRERERGVRGKGVGDGEGRVTDVEGREVVTNVT